MTSASRLSPSRVEAVVFDPTQLYSDRNNPAFALIESAHFLEKQKLSGVVSIRKILVRLLHAETDMKTHTYRLSSTAMQRHFCCRRTATTAPPKGFMRFMAWVLPSVVLAVMPKCPLCFIAAISLITGVGVSINTGRLLRSSGIVVCVALLAFVTICEVRRYISRFSKPLHPIVETKT